VTRALGYSAALAAATADNKLAWRWFVRVDIATPVGTKRFCDYATPGVQTLNIDGTTQAWNETDVLVGGLDQGVQSKVSFVDFSNLDGQWTAWALTPGLRSAAVRVYHVQFNADGTLAGPVKMYQGMVGGQSHLDRTHLELVPSVNPYSKNGLWLTVRDFGAGAFMPDRAVPVV